MTKKIFSIFLCALSVCVFFICGKDVNAMHEGFTATELASSQTITIDGTKDASWDSATAFNLDTVRQYNLNGGADNTNPATGQISVMYNSNKLYLFAEITDSTKLNNVSAWDPFNVLEYDSYKYNTDYLNIQLDIKHNDPTNYGQGWGSSYNDGKDVAAHFELAAGAGELTYSANGSTGWVYDTSNELFTLSQYATTHSTIYSVATETGYTFEMVIDLSEAGVTDFAAGKTIGLYVGYWDRYDSCGGSWGEQSLTTTAFEWNNYEPWNGPGWLPEVTFIGSSVSGDDNGETPDPTPSVPTATQTRETLGAADGVKDEAYNAATVIPVTHVAWESENPTPATANMYLLWDASYLYVFVEVTDDTYYGYQEGAWLESRDALEMIVDLYHNTSYTGGYGGDYRGDKMCEGYYKIAAGVGTASVDSTVQGTHWMWDDQKNNGSYASALTETGYTVEYKISVGKDAAEFMVADREIGLGVKIYDRHADDKDTSKTVLEGKNDGQHEGPHNLSSIKLVGTEKPVEPDPVVPNGFTATELFGNSIILVDGVKDSNWDASNPINIDQVRKQYLFNSAKSNANPATGNLKVMFTGNKLYIFVEVTDSTRDMNNISAWDAYGLNSYNSYKYHADHLDIYLDIKHDDPTNYGQAWGSAYNNGKDVAAHFELAAGAGNLTYAADGSTGWLYEPYADGQFSLAQYAVNHSTMYSVATETGYTFEMVIDLSEAGVTDFLVGKTIGLYVGYYDRYETSDAAANWGEQSVTTTSFAFDNYEPWNGPGWLPEVTFVANEAAEILEAAKSSAKEELAGYKSADLYREAEQAQLAAILAAANSAIDAVVVEDGITAIVTEAKAAIDALKTDAQYDEEEALGLENLKLSSKEELAGYKSVDLYREAEQTQLATILAAANTAIDEATSFDQVYEVITSSKVAIDALKTKAQYEAEELAAVKTSAKEELTGYKSADLYREAEQTQLATIIENANTAIDEATTADAVASALAAAKTAIDALKTKAQYETEELVAAKTSAKEELTGYKSADLYREAEQAQLASAVETGKTSIDAAVTTDAVASALAAAKTAIDALKTKAQYEAEELATAKNNAKAELDSYKSVDYYRTAEGVTYLTAVDNGKSAIDAATTVDAVNTALAAAKTAIDSIKTKDEYEAEEQAAAAAKALSDAKNAAKAELETYKSLEGLTEEQKTEVASKVAEGKTAIDDATTTEAVASALAAAKTALDGITPVPAKKGCAGSIAVTLFGMLILAGLVFVLKKKKKLA